MNSLLKKLNNMISHMNKSEELFDINMPEMLRKKFVGARLVDSYIRENITQEKYNLTNIVEITGFNPKDAMDVYFFMAGSKFRIFKTVFYKMESEYIEIDKSEFNQLLQKEDYNGKVGFYFNINP